MAMKTLILLLCLAAVNALHDGLAFSGFKVFRASASTAENLEVLRALEAEDFNIDFWSEPCTTLPTDIMVAPEDIYRFKQIMEENGIPIEVIIEDVQRLIRDVTRQDETQKPVDWKDYNTLQEIHAWLGKVASESNGRARVTEVGKSTEGNSLKLLVVGKGPKKVWIDGGIHAREWISTAVVTFIINELLKPENAALLEAYEWHLLPVQNPDGYLFTFQSEKNRLWRKTRSVLPNSTCRGVDGNRNWDFWWATGGSSPDKCHDAYHGPKANSEPEVALVDAHFRKNHFHIVLTLHSYKQVWMSPFAYTNNKSADHKELIRAANKAAAALKAVDGKTFKVGTVYEIFGFTSGSSLDWMKVIAKAKYTYAIELRDEGEHGFLLPKEQIIPSGKEMWAAVKTLAHDVKDKN